MRPGNIRLEIALVPFKPAFEQFRKLKEDALMHTASTPPPANLFAPLADTLTTATSLEGLVRPLLELLEVASGLESTYMTTIDETVGVQHVLYSRNSRSLIIPEGLTVPWGDTLCKRALEEGRSYTDDVAGCWGDSDAAQALGVSEGAIIEEGSPADLFDHPQSERLQSFLAKVL